MHRFDPARHASTALRALSETTGYPTHFAIRSVDEAVYVDKQEGRRPFQMPSRIGMSIELHTTAIGKAILAELSDEEVLAISRRVPDVIAAAREVSAALGAAMPTAGRT